MFNVEVCVCVSSVEVYCRGVCVFSGEVCLCPV